MSNTINDSLNRRLFQLGFEISPIILVGGIAANAQNGMMTIIEVLQPGVNAAASAPDNLDQLFAHFRPLPNTTLISQQVGLYPFANQSVAANATISQPLTISMIMVCPASSLSYQEKNSILTGLQNTLAQHNSSGGYYIVATPSFTYSNCLLMSLHDVSGQGNKQPQTEWQFDFIQPLLTLQQAQQAYNTQMGKIAGGVQTDGSTSGPNVTTGGNFTQLTGSSDNSVVPNSNVTTDPTSLLTGS